MGETGHVYKSIGRNCLRERLKGKTEGLRELETFMEGDRDQVRRCTRSALRRRR